MKVITVQGFWAWAIAAGHKLIENRAWRTSYRGQLAIHCGLSRKWDHESLKFLRGLRLEPPAEIPRGAIVAVAELVDVIEYEPPPVETLLEPDTRDVRLRAPHAFGPFCWCLENVRPLSQPVVHTGFLGLKDVPRDTRDQIRRQLSAKGA